MEIIQLPDNASFYGLNYPLKPVEDSLQEGRNVHQLQVLELNHYYGNLIICLRSWESAILPFSISENCLRASLLLKARLPRITNKQTNSNIEHR